MSDVFKYIADKINEELKNIEADMAEGKAKDFGDYKFHCGRHRGLLSAKGILMEVKEKVYTDDDDD